MVTRLLAAEVLPVATLRSAIVPPGPGVGVAVGTDAEREGFIAQGASWVVQGSDQSLLRQAAAALKAHQPSARRAS